jgi:WD40 repeat protein
VHVVLSNLSKKLVRDLAELADTLNRVDVHLWNFRFPWEEEDRCRREEPPALFSVAARFCSICCSILLDSARFSLTKRTPFSHVLAPLLFSPHTLLPWSFSFPKSALGFAHTYVLDETGKYTRADRIRYDCDVNSLAWDPEKRQLYIALSTGVIKTYLVPEDYKSHTFVSEFDPHKQGCTAVQYCAATNSVVSASADSNLSVYNLDTQTSSTLNLSAPVGSMLLEADGSRAVVGCADQVCTASLYVGLSFRLRMTHIRLKFRLNVISTRAYTGYRWRADHPTCSSPAGRRLRWPRWARAPQCSTRARRW